MKKTLAILFLVFVICILILTIPFHLTPSETGTCPALLSSAPPGLLSTVPDVRQSEPSSCGAADTQAVFSYGVSTCGKVR